MNAMGLTFFSLSLGCTILVTYGLYLKDSTDIPSSAGWISYLAIQTGILAGLMIMPAVFAMGQDPKAGPGLVFITIPLVFSQIPFGAAFAAFFYVCLLVAALTSAISLVEVVVAYLCYEWHLSRKRASLLIYITIFLLGSASALSFGPWSGWTVGGKILFDLLDYVCTNIMMPAGGLAIAILAGWIARDKFRAQISQVRKYPEGVLRFLTFAVRYLAPVMVLLVLISGL
jgi:NSS family neurotransmitter:Na+ symporter